MLTLVNSSGHTPATALEPVSVYLNISAHYDRVMTVQGQWHSSFSLPSPIHPFQPVTQAIQTHTDFSHQAALLQPPVRARWDTWTLHIEVPLSLAEQSDIKD